jgi:SDR family mycofactocin-dependent oxidoreductase
MKGAGVGQLDGKVAFITGGARGQGRSHAVALAREGCDVALFDVAAQLDAIPYSMATAQDLAETAQMVEQTGRRCVALKGDVRSTPDVDAAIESTVGQLGGLDIVVANAGVIAFHAVEVCSDEEWDAIVGTNLTGVFKVLRASVPHLRSRGGGRIVTISSMVGRKASPNIPHYVAAKFGVIGLTKALAQELKGTGITVNAICPATLASDLFYNQATVDLFFPDRDDATIDDLKAMPLDGLTQIPILQPEDITRAVMYLVLDPGVMTGQALEVGNGMSAFLA